MKSWFPFVDYEFYSYLACGLVVLFSIDYCYLDSEFFEKGSWTFAQSALLISLAYVVGQIIAIPASMLLEHGVARRVLRAPAVILLSASSNSTENFIERFLIGRHYSPLPSGVINKIFANAQRDTGLSRTELEGNVQEVFVPALNAAKAYTEINHRINMFRNQYTFSRNMAFSGFLASAFLIVSAFQNGNASALSVLLFALFSSLGMLIRFLKFYSCCANEVLRAYAYHK